MTTLRIWMTHATQHPLTTFMGALPTIYSVCQWILANRGASNLEIVWAITALLLGAAMKDPDKWTPS